MSVELCEKMSEAEIKKALGRRLSKLRKTHGYSQDTFAKEANLSINGLSKIETGKGFISAETMAKILEVLQVQPCELFTFEEVVTKKEMYEDILQELEFMKNSPEKVEMIYRFMKSINS